MKGTYDTIRINSKPCRLKWNTLLNPSLKLILKQNEECKMGIRGTTHIGMAHSIPAHTARGNLGGLHLTCNAKRSTKPAQTAALTKRKFCSRTEPTTSFVLK